MKARIVSCINTRFKTLPQPRQWWSLHSGYPSSASSYVSLHLHPRHILLNPPSPHLLALVHPNDKTWRGYITKTWLMLPKANKLLCLGFMEQWLQLPLLPHPQRLPWLRHLCCGCHLNQRNGSYRNKTECYLMFAHNTNKVMWHSPRPRPGLGAGTGARPGPWGAPRGAPAAAALRWRPRSPRARPRTVRRGTSARPIRGDTARVRRVSRKITALRIGHYTLRSDRHYYQPI